MQTGEPQGRFDAEIVGTAAVRRASHFRRRERSLHQPVQKQTNKPFLGFVRAAEMARAREFTPEVSR